MLAATTFPPAEVEILGDLDYGRTSDSLECSAKQQYCSVLFNGLSGDRVVATVTGATGKPFVAIADGTLTELAHGEGEASVTLPEVTDKLATYYIVFRDPARKAGRFTVRLEKQNEK
jgi:hypothetical protein